MAKTRSRSPRALLSTLLTVGAIAACIAFWISDHRTMVGDSGGFIAILLGTYFVCWAWALIRYLQWRDQRSSVAAVRTTYRPELDGTIYGLVRGDDYRVRQSFTDYYGNQFQRGEVLRFKERHFLPYHDGHTIVFEGRSLYLQETQNEAILANFSEYIARIT